MRFLYGRARQRKPRLFEFSMRFAWYDGWMGFYWDRAQRCLYVCPLPFWVWAWQFSRSRKCKQCGRRPLLGEPEVRWGYLKTEVYRKLRDAGVELGHDDTVGSFCRDCGKADSDAGK